LSGCDSTTGIVAVDADARGHARVWRRLGIRVELEDHQFPNWFLTTNLDLLAHLPRRHLTSDWLRTAHGQLLVDHELSVVELDAPTALGAEDQDAYRYLVLTTNLQDVETALIETANKRDAAEARTLADLRGLVLIWHPIEQFLTLTGRTYFKDLRFDDLRRMQFDLETTGLNEDRDRIFMISMGDSSGWRDCLETEGMNEGKLLERFVQIVQARDPDTLENHNIFGFDLPFLVKRAARLGVRLALGRDGSEPRLETDSFDGGERPEPFLRWRIAGREVIDTQHAVRRFGAAVPNMRRHGLKEAARYLGLARADREYVAGADVWPTYRTDPERIRRYAADDVEEVDALSRRLLLPMFELASMLPRAYERIAADTGPTALWELLLVRAYLHEARAIGAPMPRLQRPPLTARPELLIKGVVGPSVHAVVERLLPSVLAERTLTAANDELGVMPRIVEELLALREVEGAHLLAEASHRYLSGTGLFADPAAAAHASAVARHHVEGVLDEVRLRGCAVVEIDGPRLALAVPASWDQNIERQIEDAVADRLPGGVQLQFVAHHQALYARAPGTAISLARDGTVTLIGPAFRPGRLERFGEAFMLRAAPHALSGDAVALRQVFLETVHLLRTRQVPLDDLCVQVTLHKSLPQYRRGGTHEEPYEVLLAAGIRSWRVGQRIRYFRARGGEPRLLLEGDGLTAAEADTEYYVQRLSTLYCQQFAQAFGRQDFPRIFRLPVGDGPYDEPDMANELAGIRTIAEAVTA
jgi:uncharacterized protein YprB with RNaseH-like and TPR domain